MADVLKNLELIESDVLSGLKDFQRATVDRIDKLYREGQRRILVSDEVGLGKTLIARGTIAKLARLRNEEGDKLFKVVYICSNAAIAGQNLSNLRISDELRVEDTGSSRLSMQHLRIFRQEYDPELKSRFIQLIPITPDTSFRMTYGTGSVDERALMFAILHRLPDLLDHVPALETAMKDYAFAAWKGWAKIYWEREVANCDEKTQGEYLKHMISAVQAGLLARQKNEPSYLDQLIDLCNRVSQNGFRRVSNNDIIGKLRVLFAQISVDLLNPDFVIMDEFQRFKYVINSESNTETGLLVKRFFSGKNVRILMLSATPYKMYSTLEEINEIQIDDHYSEFFKVMEFLEYDPSSVVEFKEIWRDYSCKLREFSLGDSTIIEVKKLAEDALYSKICRTERISETCCADLIDDSGVRTPISVSIEDVRSYLQAQNLLTDMNANFSIPVDYVKSTPYLLSFMRDYQLKRYIEKYFKANPLEMRKADKNCLWLQRSQIENYRPLDTKNARLALVMKRAFEQRSERLLWVPPSKPYYELSGPFKGTEGFSKMLIFSSWEMVPRMLASMLSYESERKNITSIIEHAGQEIREAKYFTTDNKRYPAARLNFSVSLGRTSGMPLFCLLYPCHFLASCFSPIDAMNRKLTLKQIETEVSGKISEKLAGIKSRVSLFGREDDRWYYFAPLLMDAPSFVDGWLKASSSLADIDDSESDGKKQKGYAAHLNELNYLWKFEKHELGKQPRDLVDVLTMMAIASPAICVFRTYRANSSVNDDRFIQPDMPSKVAKVFINRMNTPEATAVIEAFYGKSSDDAHWKNVLNYCKAGNLQSVFDEYAHILIESNGLRNDKHKVSSLHLLILDSMNIRTALYTIDTYNEFKARTEGNKSRPLNMRSHFAVAFTKGDSRSDKDTDRKKTVRNAFNSPFRPFVLASTSIGQEGLDFHYYCRRIVHWNLPSNPIDLEQREGRINRFKGLVIRQNVARRYGGIAFREDIWNELFDEALRNEKTANGSELIPFWGLSETPDMLKIERIVPMYPLSRDIPAYERLIKILSLYRLTLGQARQEELLEFIFKNYAAEDLKNLFINLSPFYKRISEARISDEN